MKDLIYGVWFWIKSFFVGLPQNCVTPKEEQDPHANMANEDVATKPQTKRKSKRKHGQKLDCKVIIWCRDQFAKGESIRSLADKMGVNSSTLTRAIAGKTYKHCKGK